MKPLEGIKVVDFTTYAAGPSCSKALADWGADVIKVEPEKGEPYRVFGKTVGIPIDDDENPAYELDNANKRIIAVNAKTEEGLAIIHKLLADADVFITNYRDKALRKLRLSYEDLSPLYPQLVYGFISGYGRKGELAELPGFDFTAYWARGGFMAMLGEPDAIPVTGLPGFGDQTAGMFLAGGVAAALAGRLRSGKGEKVEVSLYHTAIWVESSYILINNYGDNGKKTRFHPKNPMVNIFGCRDGKWLGMCLFEYARFWPRVSKCLGLEDYLEDPRFIDIDAALAHSKELTQLFDEAFITKDAAEWERIFSEADIPCQMLFDGDDINKDPQALENDYLREVKFRNGNTAILATTPCQFKEGGPVDWRLSQALGADTREVLQSLGYSDDEIAELEEKKVITCN